MEKRYIGGSITGGVKNSPTIENEVCKSCYAALRGLFANLEYDEEKQERPNEMLLAYYLSIRRSLWNIQDEWRKYNDEEIQAMIIPVSTLIKTITGSYEQKKLVVKNHHDYLISIMKQEGEYSDDYLNIWSN